MKSKKEDEMKEQPLFGKGDQVYSAVATEKTIVAAEMKAIDKSIERREREKDALEERYMTLAAALKILEFAFPFEGKAKKK